MTVHAGNSAKDYNYQGVVSKSKRSFSKNEKLIVTWYNNHPTKTFTFTPRISFTNRSRPTTGGVWHSMTSLKLAPRGTGKTEYVITDGSAGNYSVVNVNDNIQYYDARSLVCDKIELVPKN